MPADLTVELIAELLPTVMGIHNQNRKKIDKLLNYVDGTEQAIDRKKRKYENQQEHNNKIKDNHAYALVNFKEGFLLGDKREFTQKSDSDSDDLTYFDRYLTDVSFYGKDVDVKHNIYSTGIGIDFVQPRTDIFMAVDGDNTKLRYKTVDEGYDIDNDSPFVYESLDCRYNGIVYSSLIGLSGVGDLFDYSISEVYNTKKKQTEKIITVYTREFTVRFDTQYKQIGEVIPTPPTYKELPMTAHTINSAQEGIIEIVLDLLDSANTIISNSVDNIVDRVNQVIVFKNTEFPEGKTVADMLRSGAIQIKNENQNDYADVDTISVDLKLTEVNTTYEEIVTKMYDKVGVPLATASVTSGGDTGQARLLGAGWTNAYSIIKRDIMAMEQGDREMLRKMIKICQANADNRLNDILVNQIDIKYSVNLSDNLLVKTQAMQNMYSINVPKPHILKAVNIWSDTKTVSEDWEQADDKAKELARETTVEQVTETEVETPTVDDNLDNKVKSQRSE